MMPLATALLKLALFALWAHPTYKATVDMYERRERRQGILPEKDGSGDGAERRTGEEKAETAGAGSKRRRTGTGA